jgi:hypothetical protein
VLKPLQEKRWQKPEDSSSDSGADSDNDNSNDSRNDPSNDSATASTADGSDDAARAGAVGRMPHAGIVGNSAPTASGAVVDTAPRR